MTTVEYILTHIFPVAFKLLPEKMNTKEAQALLIAIALQESRFEHRRQVGGPARGFWQFEKMGGVHGVLNHHATGLILHPILDQLSYKQMDLEVYTAIEHNDVLAVICARLLLWTVPGRLPSSKEDFEGGWRTYLNGWRPGKPHRETWDPFYSTGWRLLS